MLCTTLRRYELRRSIGFRKWSVITTIAPRKSLHPCGYVPREKSRKTWVLGFPRTPKTEVVGHSSLSVRQGSANGSGTAQERIRLNGGAPSAIPPPLRGAPSRSHAPFLSVLRTEEGKPRTSARRSVTIPVKPVISLSHTSRRKQFQQEVFDHLHCEMLVAPLDTLVQDCQEYIDHLEYPRTFG